MAEKKLGGLSLLPPLPASPLSARSQLNEAFARALLADFRVCGAEVIAEVREERPAEYLQLIATIATARADEDEAMSIEAFNETLALAAQTVRGGATIH